MSKENRLIVFVLCCAICTVGGIVVYADLTRHDWGDVKETQARMKAKVIRDACMAFRVNTGAYPARLAELIGEEKLYLEGGENALKDPWGQPFQFTLIQDADGDSTPVVWTIRTISFGRKRILSWPKDVAIPGL
jgi:hypothetical protein